MEKLQEKSGFFRTRIKILQFAVAHGSGEGQHVADVAHAGQVHDTALKSKAKAGVTAGAVLAQIHVETVILGIHA